MALRSGRVGIHPSQVDPITGMLLSGPSGSTNYNDLSNKPQINGVTLSGNKTTSDLHIEAGASDLSNLDDVSIDNPEEGDYLMYDSTSGKWVNSGAAPGPVLPDGKTVLPTDDIQTWLACAGITDKTYTTLNEVLSDSTTLLALISDNNAVDYLVRSTTWASGITADSTAMTDIGANNYCANTLLSNSTWCNAICNSTYFESVLNTKVPTMTSDTTPSGVASASTVYSADYAAWKAFNFSESNGWAAHSSYTTNAWVRYEFNNPMVIKKFTATMTNRSYLDNMKVQGSNTGNSNDFTDLLTCSVSESGTITKNVNNSTAYKYYRVFGNTNTNGYGYHFQFYGR